MTSRISPLHSRSAARRMLGVLAIFWLNLAVMPCAMAIEADTKDEHCPQMSSQAMVHEGGDQVSQPEVDCLSMQADCCSFVQSSVDNRAGSDKFKKDTSAVLASPASWPNQQSLQVLQREHRPPDPVYRSPPLHVLHCAYLK